MLLVLLVVLLVVFCMLKGFACALVSQALGVWRSWFLHRPLLQRWRQSSVMKGTAAFQLPLPSHPSPNEHGASERYLRGGEIGAAIGTGPDRAAADGQIWFNEMSTDWVLAPCLCS